MTRKDVFITILVGLFTALVWISVFLRLETFEVVLFKEAAWGLLIIVPLGYLVALYLGRVLSRFFGFLNSFVKFVMIGFLNTGIDLALFNLLMTLTEIEKGLAVSLFKGIAVVVAFTNSYFWNKYWAFNAGRTVQDKTTEFVKFITVNIIGVLINVGVTSGIIFFIPPQFAFSQIAWNNVAAVAATVISLMWNFIGFRLIVFKSNVTSSL